MRLLVGERNSLIEGTLDCLQHIPLSETGRIVRVTAGHATKRELALSRYALLSNEQSSAAEEFIRRQPRGGILYIGARSGVAAKSVLRNMLVATAFDARHLAIFGLHQWSLEEHDFVMRQRIQLYSMIEISREGLSEMTDAVMMYVRNWEEFHLVLNLDVVDPAFAPGLYTSVVGGLSAREMIYVLQRLLLIPSLSSVEIIANGEADAQTCGLAARLLAECIAGRP